MQDANLASAALSGRSRPAANFDVVVVACSLGGLAAVASVVRGLHEGFPAPVVIVQHTHAGSPSHMPELLRQHSALPVRHARDGEVIRRGTNYVAPPGPHLQLREGGVCRLVDGPRVSFARPAADALFRSAAAVFGARTLGVVLTGRLHDGTAGSVAIKAAGGVVIAQDPATCRAPDMPRSVIRAGAAHFVLPPPLIGAALVSFVCVFGVSALFGVGGVGSAA